MYQNVPMHTSPPFLRLPPPCVCTPEVLKFYDDELARFRHIFETFDVSSPAVNTPVAEPPGTTVETREEEKSSAPKDE